MQSNAIENYCKIGHQIGKTYEFNYPESYLIYAYFKIADSHVVADFSDPPPHRIRHDRFKAGDVVLMENLAGGGHRPKTR